MLIHSFFFFFFLSSSFFLFFFLLLPPLSSYLLLFFLIFFLSSFFFLLASFLLLSSCGGVMRTMSSSWMSALRKALVISILDHVVSLEHARLSINRKSAASRLVVVVECSPHVAKLPQITIRLLCLYSSWMSLPCCCDCVSGLRTKTIWHGSGHSPLLFH